MIYYFMQQNFGKKTLPGEEGYENDHGYDPPVEEEEDENLFKTWWDPATKGHTESAEPDADKKLGGESSSDIEEKGEGAEEVADA